MARSAPPSGNIVRAVNDCGPDARRDHDALLDAARHVLAVDAAEPPLEEIARRDGVGIATLYRNFPTRRELLEAVYVHEVAPVGGRSRTERRR